MTLYEKVEECARNNPDNFAFSYFGYRETYRVFLKNTDEAAQCLTAHGYVRGDRIALCMPNSPRLLHFLYAINKIGAVAVLLNPKSPYDELKRQLKMTKAKAVFITGLSLYAMSLFKVPFVDVILVPIIDHLPLYLKFAIYRRTVNLKLMSEVSEVFGKRFFQYYDFMKDKADVEKQENDEADAVIIFSGGTSGTMKAVVHSSKALLYSGGCLQREPVENGFSTMAILPAFHIFGLTIAILLPLHKSGTAVLVPFFNLRILTGIIKKECPQIFPGVPTIFERLLAYKGFNKLAAAKKLHFESLVHIFVGGDALKEETRQAFNEIIKANGGNGYISTGYGMSECCPISSNERSDFDAKSVGKPYDGVDVKILGDGKCGEISIASKYLMSYMFDEEGKITEPMPDEDGVYRLNTGDIGYYRDGKIFFECRQRRIIKVSGNTVFAKAVEETLLAEIPCAQDVYIVPVTHEKRGYGTFAYLVTEKEFADEEVLKIVQGAGKDKLLPYAIPIGASAIKPSEVPRTELSKIAWGKLEDLAQNKMQKENRT